MASSTEKVKEAVVAPSAGRVKRMTPSKTQAKIDKASIESVRAAAESPRMELEVDRRIQALNKEWDVERSLMFNAATLSSLGNLLGRYVSPAWYWFSLGVTLFLLQHAMQGWCPPLPVFRALGFRTVREILDEMTALRVLRGDFAFAGGMKGPTGRTDVLAMMIHNKEHTGTFVPEAGTGATAAKEE